MSDIKKQVIPTDRMQAKWSHAFHGNLQPFGDECEINIPDEPINCSSLNYFDKLEYDCWNLIQNYANKFGIKIEGEISFDLAKEIQDCIIRQFEDAGVKFKF